MGLFSPRGSTAASKLEARPAEPPAPLDPAGRKGRPTPSRREAEAARMARLHPELDPKAAKRLDREARAQERTRQMDRMESVPERQLLRNVVDARFNVGEIALPLLMLLIVVSILPGVAAYGLWVIGAMYLVLLVLALDTVLMWQRFKRLHRERMPSRPTRGLLFYGWNRQMTMRRWRQPPPVVARGEAF